MSVLEAIFCAILLVKLELPAFRPWFELQIRAHDPFAVRSPRWASVAAHYVSRVGLCFGCGEIILTKRTVDLDLIRSPRLACSRLSDSWDGTKIHVFPTISEPGTG